MSFSRPSIRLIGLLALTVLVGCRSATTGPETASAPPPSAAGATFRVALLLPGSKDDQGWNQLAWEGLPLIERELGARTSDQRATAAQALESMRAYARDGYQLIFAHGSEYEDAARQAAKEFPQTDFVITSAEAAGENLASIHWDLSDAAYLAGILAAGLSKTGRAGQLGGQDLAAVAEGFRAFERGARSLKPDFQVQTTYVGNWDDANLGKEKALALIGAGADVLFQNADQAGRGAFLAARESAGREVFVIGSNRNQNEDYPDTVCASAVLDIPQAMLQIARDVQSGDFQPNHVYRENLASGAVRLEINPKFRDRIPPETQAALEAAERAIRAGELDPLGDAPA